MLQLLENLQPQVWLYLQSLIKANKNTYINKFVPLETSSLGIYADTYKADLFCTCVLISLSLRQLTVMGPGIFLVVVVVFLFFLFSNKSPFGTCHSKLVFVMLLVQGKKHTLNSIFKLSCNQACIFIRGEKFSSEKFKLFIDFHFCVQVKLE